MSQNPYKNLLQALRDTRPTSTGASKQNSVELPAVSSPQTKPLSPYGSNPLPARAQSAQSGRVSNAGLNERTAGPPRAQSTEPPAQLDVQIRVQEPSVGPPPPPVVEPDTSPPMVVAPTNVSPVSKGLVPGRSEIRASFMDEPAPRQKPPNAPLSPIIKGERESKVAVVEPDSPSKVQFDLPEDTPSTPPVKKRGSSPQRAVRLIEPDAAAIVTIVDDSGRKASVPKANALENSMSKNRRKSRMIGGGAHAWSLGGTTGGGLVESGAAKRMSVFHRGSNSTENSVADEQDSRRDSGITLAIPTSKRGSAARASIFVTSGSNSQRGSIVNSFAGMMQVAELAQMSSKDEDRKAVITLLERTKLFTPKQLSLMKMLDTLSDATIDRMLKVQDWVGGQQGGEAPVAEPQLDPAPNPGRTGGEEERNHSESTDHGDGRPLPESTEGVGFLSGIGARTASVSVPFLEFDAPEDSQAPLPGVDGSDEAIAVNGGGVFRGMYTTLRDSNGMSVNDDSMDLRRTSIGRHFIADNYGFDSFVSDLALSSFQLSVHDEPVCVSVDVEACLLFIDISGYSKLSAALESRGAFTLFSIVNEYVSQLVDIVIEFDGQVIKFAGDAIKCVWHYESQRDSVEAAVRCAIALQERCGKHNVPDSELVFSIHIGVVAGNIKSTVFRSSTVKNMESCYHLIGGEPLHAVGDVVDAATSGETCIAESVAKLLNDTFKYEERGAAKNGSKIYVLSNDERGANIHTDRSLAWGDDNFEPPEHYVGDVSLDYGSRSEHTNSFIAPSIAAQLKKGKSQSEMAEMKLLTVLFIQKTDPEIDIGDWFVEVQHVVDQFRCGIVQIIEDDKGVHIIAAVNLHVPDREPASTGVQLADALVKRKCGCTIGLATGITFCGVVGNTNAARFDITGNVCVRACRLMQFAAQQNISVAIGHSVVQYAGDQSLTMPLGEATVKGESKPVQVYGIAEVDTSILSSITTGGNVCAEIHTNHFNTLRTELINNTGLQRGAAVIRGSSSTGKSVLCARAVYDSGFVAFSHVCVQDSRPLDILWTIGSWFANHRDGDVSSIAQELLAGLKVDHNIRSTATALELVNCTIAKGMRTSIVIKQAQRLDAMSLSFLRQSLALKSEGVGRWLVFATVVPQPGTTAWSAIATTLGASTITLRVGHLTAAECTAFTKYRMQWNCEQSLYEAIRVTSGWLVGLADVTCSHLEDIGAGKLTVTQAGEIRVTDEVRKTLLMAEWSTISPKICSKAAQLVSSLSLSGHTILKVIAVLSNPFLPVNIPFAAAVSATLLEGVKNKKVLKEIEFLVEMFFLEKRAPSATKLYSSVDAATSRSSDEFVIFESPAMLHVVLQTVLPAERVAIGRVAMANFGTYHEFEWCHHHFAFGHHAYNAGDKNLLKEHSRRGLERVERTRKQWKEEDITHLRVIVAVETRKRGISEISLTVDGSSNELGGSMMRGSSAFNMSINLDTLANSSSTSPTNLGASGPSFGSSMSRGSMNLRGGLAKLKRAAKSGTNELPPHVIKLRSWKPPLVFGTIGMQLRETAVFITVLAINAASQSETPEELVKEHLRRVEMYAQFKDQLDRVIGFRSSMIKNEEADFLLKVGTPTTDYNEACAHAREFTEYTEDLVQRRAERLRKHVLNKMYVPFSPSYEPVFSGNERLAQEKALQTALVNWKRDSVGSLRDGLMELATQGWVPHDSEQNIESLKDCYLRKRSHDPETFLCLLFVNLSMSLI